MNEFIENFNAAHILRMTDDTGMFQHSLYGVPNLLTGYTTDDNARALIMAVMLYEQRRTPVYLELIYRYLGFVLHAQNATGRFRNFMDYNREFEAKEGSEDCFGRCLWVLGYTYASTAMPTGIKQACLDAVHRALPNIHELSWSRGQAHALIGLAFISGPEADAMIEKLADSLVDRFEHEAGDQDWQWFEESLTYDNAALPWALFVAYKRTGQDRLLRVAQKSLDFLDRVLFRDSYFRPIGCNGWWMRGGGMAQCDEQPLEACTSVLAHLAAYEVTGDKTMLELARKSFAWYVGENSRHESLIDLETGGCCDGIMTNGLNQNQGAESIVGYAIAGLALMKYPVALTAPMGKSEIGFDDPVNAQLQGNEALSVYRPWGFYTVMGSGPGFKMKRIVVNPGQILSLQMHYHRSEHWVVISGTAKVTVGETESMLHENEGVFIPQTSRHRVENPGQLPLEIIEVQNGVYLGEDDIVRFADKYGRA